MTGPGRWRFRATLLITMVLGSTDSIGAVYGYKGKLSKYGNKPLKNTFLFKHNVSPVLVLDVFYRVSDHLQLQVMSTYLAVLGGIKYDF